MMIHDPFTEQVHAVVVQLSDWMKAEAPDPDKLIPALAVVLGRVMARRARSKEELVAMIDMAVVTMSAAATEHWEAVGSQH